MSGLTRLLKDPWAVGRAPFRPFIEMHNIYPCSNLCLLLCVQVTYDMHIEGQKHKKKERNQQHINDVTGEPVPKDIVPR